MIGRCKLLGMVLAAGAIASPAGAQSDYPNRPIQLIVPYGAGGVADVGMRIMAEKLSIRLKQQVVVEISLTRLLDLSLPGKYLVNVSRQVDASASGAPSDPFIVSNTVAFELKEQ